MSRAARLTRRTVLATAAAAAADLAGALPAHAMPRLLHGGFPVTAAALPSFQLVEHSNTSSLGFKRFGFPVVPGDVPVGSRVRLTRGGVDIPAQFDKRASHWGGSGALYFASCCIRDAAFSANEARTYVPVVEVGAFDNTSTLDLSTALAGRDFKVAIPTMSGSTTGAFNSHTASLNAFVSAHPVTRVTKDEAGPICDSWIVWGMAVDDVTGLEHAHLKVMWYVSFWKNSDGSIAGWEAVPVLAQDWWDVAGKETLTYDATFLDGATTIVSYAGVKHVYNMQWAMLRTNNDNEHATRPWIGASRPTLLFKPNQAHWIASNLVPPQRLDITFVMDAAYTNTYIPGSALGHRADVAAEGNYPGRGLITNMDCVAFVTPTAANVRIARVASHAGLHIPNHNRSHDLRTRPGDGGVSDISNTTVANIIWDERSSATPSSFYDFTADGLPAPVHAYFDNRTDVSLRHGYVYPTGGTTSASAWSGVYDGAHVVVYSYYQYLYSGESYFLPVIQDTAAMCYQSDIGSADFAMAALTWYNSFNPPAERAIYPGTPSTQWAAIATRALAAGVTRRIGWRSNALLSLVVTPDNDPHINHNKTLVAVNAKYLKKSVDLIPASATGSWSPTNGSGSPWMDNFIAMAGYTGFLRTGDMNWRAPADYITQMGLNWYTLGMIGMAESYRLCLRPHDFAHWVAITNDWFPEGGFWMSQNIFITAATDRITVSSTDLGGVGLTNGDELVFAEDNETLTLITVPSEITLGQRYYAANVVGQTFQISSTPDLLSIIDFTSDYADVATGPVIGMRPTKLSSRANMTRPIITSNPGMMVNAVINLAKRGGNPAVTQAVVDAYNAFYASNRADPTWATWTLTT